MSDLLNIEGSQSLKRDMASKAVVQTSRVEFEAFLRKKQQKKSLEQKIASLEERVKSLEELVEKLVNG